MLAREAELGYSYSVSETGPGAAWITGAMAGLRIAKPRDSWEWNRFVEDLHIMFSAWSDLTPVEIGAIPIDSEGREGSIYDSIGGYVSVAGKIVPRGLHFKVLGSHIGSVVQMFRNLSFQWSDGGLVVPWTEIAGFCRLVSIRGPIMDELDRRGSLD